jgi:hypothetical protein
MEAIFLQSKPRRIHKEISSISHMMKRRKRVPKMMRFSMPILKLEETIAFESEDPICLLRRWRMEISLDLDLEPDRSVSILNTLAQTQLIGDIEVLQQKENGCQH